MMARFLSTVGEASSEIPYAPIFSRWPQCTDMKFIARKDLIFYLDILVVGY